MTDLLFIDQPTLAATRATVLRSAPDGIVLDRTVFYARAGGQPGDMGVLSWDGGKAAIADTRKDEAGDVLHLPEPRSALPPEGAIIEAALDWGRRYRHMRMHTTLHLLCSLIPGAAVTGGQIGAERSRLDFDLPDPPAKDELEAQLNAMIAENYPVGWEWAEENVLDENPGLVRTLSVKPPRGTGRLRLVRIGTAERTIDLQPCGGTHVARTAEIGQAEIVKIENKGRQNRRIMVMLK